MELDEELVAKARRGDARAFGALIERHQRAVAGLLLSVLHDVDAAEEAAQQAFVKAFKNMAAFEGRSSFKTWVTRIALNTARSQRRWSGLRRWLSLDAPSGPDRETTWAERLGGGDEGQALERKLDLERALAGLAPREREIAALRLEGFTLGEIAQTLDVSEGTVKSTLFDATQKMRRRLQ